MASNIVSTAVKISTDNTGLDQGLAKAQSSIMGFATQINSSLTVFASGFTGIMLNLGQQLIGAFADIFDRVGMFNDLSQQVGIGVQSLMGLAHAASFGGISVEDLGASLRKLVGTIGEANLGSVEARDAFARLGITADQLRTNTPEQTFMAIADSINRLESPVDRARSAMDIFGRSGAQLLPMFERGADGIREAMQEAERLGISLNDVDAARIDEAGDAFGRMKSALVGILQQIAVAIAPAVQGISDAITGIVGVVMPIVQQIIAAFQPIGERLGAIFSAIMEQAQPIIQGIADAFVLVADIVTPILDVIMSLIQMWIDIFTPVIEAIQSVLPPFETIRHVVLTVIIAIVTGFRMLLQIVATVVRALSRIPIIGRMFRGASAGLDSFVENVRSSENRLRESRDGTGSRSSGGGSGGRSGGGATTAAAALATDIAKAEDELRKQVNTFGMSRDEIQLYELAQRGATDAQLANVRALQAQRRELEIAANVRKITDELNKQIATMGMSRDEIQLWELAQQGATGQQLEQVRALQAVRREMEENQRLMEDGRKLTEEMRSPQEKFQAEMERLQQLLDRGAISFETYSRASSRALEGLQREMQNTADQKLPSAQFRGSREAVETIIRHNMRNDPANDRENVMQRIATEQRELSRSQLNVAQDILRTLRDNRTTTI
jgi:hypothetical protein